MCLRVSLQEMSANLVEVEFMFFLSTSDLFEDKPKIEQNFPKHILWE